jgi:PAS domain S-box-containing protein
VVSVTRLARRGDAVIDNPANERRGYWRGILDGVEQPIIVARPDGIVAEFNTAAEQLTGYAAGEVIGRMPLAALYDSRQIAARSRAVSLERGEWIEPGFDTLLAAATRAVPEQSWTLVRKDGRPVAVNVSWRTLRGEHGTLEGCLVLPREDVGLALAAKAVAASPAAAPPSGRDTRAAPEPCFAPGEALRRLNGDSALLAELAGLFLRERASHAAEIQRAVDERDPTGVERGAHRLRSALLNLAAAPAARAALGLEESGRRGRVPLPEQLALLFTELDRLAEGLSSFCGSSP